MFTGIVEETGEVVERTATAGGETLVIAADKVLSDVARGHSIAVNGVCLTVVESDSDYFKVEVIPETLKRSNLGDLQPGGLVNLERAMAASDRFHGHIVQGHVETVGYINSLVVEGGDVRMTITVDGVWLRYCLPKGSITMDGVSLTIADLSAAGITVALIPFTLSHTTLGRKQVGDPVNIETDILARYVERLFEIDVEEEHYELEMGKLRNWGYGES
ncbi:MAG: riboflavin synthase [Candidatus Neomarinimicrobiota bacterium]